MIKPFTIADEILVNVNTGENLEKHASETSSSITTN